MQLGLGVGMGTGRHWREEMERGGCGREGVSLGSCPSFPMNSGSRAPEWVHFPRQLSLAPWIDLILGAFQTLR